MSWMDYEMGISWEQEIKKNKKKNQDIVKYGNKEVVKETNSTGSIQDSVVKMTDVTGWTGQLQLPSW